MYVQEQKRKNSMHTKKKFAELRKN